MHLCRTLARYTVIKAAEVLPIWNSTILWYREIKVEVTNGNIHVSKTSKKDSWAHQT